MESKKTITIIASILVVGIFLISFASAEFWACFGKGEIRDYCGNYKPSITCSHDSCEVCMSVYDPIEDCYISGNGVVCRNVPKDCSTLNDNVTYDLEPPTFDLASPLEGNDFGDRNVLVEFSLNEKSNVYYTVLNDLPVREVRVCYECSAASGGFPSFSDERIFDDGLNQVMFRATDLVGNSAYKNVSFFVDSKDPVIKDISPDNGDYASGEFQIWFNEENPTELKLLVNYSGGVDPYYINIANNCVPDRYDTLCTANINMNKYNGQDVWCHFELTDIVGNKDVSDEEMVKVDSTLPIIRSIEEIKEGRYLYFRLNYTETNLDSIQYVDLLDSRARPKDLCRYPMNGVCYGKVSLRDGDHNIQFTVIDEAGNNVSQTRSVLLDTVVPRVYKTMPRGGFADGDFEVEFKELNPSRITLHYGASSKDLNLANDCYENRGKTHCNTNVNLNQYNGAEIKYYFEVEDVVGNIGTSRSYGVDVDTTFPVVNNAGSFYSIDGRYVYFVIDITEENLDKVFYVDSRGYEKTVCTRLYDGLCKKKVSFQRGNYALSIQVRDEAGNAIGIPTGDFEINY